MHPDITSAHQLTAVSRARRDEAFVREALREAQTLLVNGERDAADIMLQDLVLGAPRTEVTLRQAANLLGASHARVEELIAHGHLVSHRTGRRRRLFLSEVVGCRGAGQRFITP